MIGQKRVKRVGKLALNSNSNLLIVAPSGHGKTTLAKELAGVKFLYLDVPYPPLKILELVEWNHSYARIVCDEIHSCNKQDDWPIFLDNFSGLVLFTTTDPQKVIEAIKTRCFTLELAPYSQRELMKISEIKGRNGKFLASLSRGIPRRAKNLGNLFKQFNGSMEDFLNMLEIKKVNGLLLFPEEISFVETLKNGPMGKENLRRVLNLADFEEVELSLLRLGIIKISRIGRELTDT